MDTTIPEEARCENLFRQGHHHNDESGQMGETHRPFAAHLPDLQRALSASQKPARS
jgi:hypothetical protein